MVIHDLRTFFIFVWGGVCGGGGRGWGRERSAWEGRGCTSAVYKLVSMTYTHIEKIKNKYLYIHIYIYIYIYGCLPFVWDIIFADTIAQKLNAAKQIQFLGVNNLAKKHQTSSFIKEFLLVDLWKRIAPKCWPFWLRNHWKPTILQRVRIALGFKMVNCPWLTMIIHG